MPYPVMPHFEFSDRPGSEVEAGAGIGGALPARPGFACCGTAQSLWRSPYMSLRADSYRQRAAEAKGRAAQARDLSIRSAFENETDVQSLRASWRSTLKVKCPHCGEVHKISVRETCINGALQDATDRLRRAI
jgi:phage FluMu protein Com